jgi:diguanylate cyclase (GGDEF)-like protein
MRHHLSRLFRRRLAFQLVASFLATALLAGAAVGTLSALQARSALREQVLSANLAAVDLAATHAAIYVAGVQASARFLATSPTLQAAIEQGNFASLAAELEHWQTFNPHAETVTFFDVDLVSRASGIEGKSLVGQKYLPATTWRDTMRATGQATLGPPVVSKATGRPVVQYAIPIYDQHGVILGDVSVDISITLLSDTLTSIHVAPSARPGLTDLDQQLILIHRDPSRVFTRTTGRNEAMNHLAKRERGVMDTQNSTGQHNLAAFAPVEGLPWGVSIQEPFEEAFAPVDAIVTNVLRLMAGALLAAVLVGLVLATRIVRPIQHLRSAASRMAAGDLSARASISRQDEIGDLGAAFDLMATQLEGTVHQLEQAIGGLREGEERLTKQYQGIPVPTYTWQRADDDFILVAYNSAAAEITRGEIARSIGVRAGVVYAELPSLQHDLANCFADRSRLTSEITYAVTPGEEPRHFVATYVYLAPDLVMVHTEDITERKRAELALAHQALHDALTGLPNRVLLGDRLQQAILTSEREERELALLVMDLDRFKEVNDTLGHHAGDRLLQEIARRLRAALRASDTVARLGGDEFAVVLPGSSDAPDAAVKLIAALEAPVDLEGHTLALGASIGIALYPQHGQTVESLLRSADVAMYTAKRARSGVAIYAPDQDQHSVDRLGLLAELREALTRDDELVLYYQPKWDLRSGALAGFEALARWQHPRRGLLEPDQFIDLAEQTGLMRPLTLYLLEAALRQVRAWQQVGVHLPVAVNLSPSSLQDIHLASEIERLLAEARVAPEWLEVEITEEAYMTHLEVAAATLARLRAMGVRVAIDDFGTGYASLVYLQKLPVDRIKIDRGFVRALLHDESQATIVRSLIDLGHNLGLEVVAEGVEDEATRAGLAALGCDYGQGYALGGAQPAADLTPVLWGSQPQQKAA